MVTSDVWYDILTTQADELDAAINNFFDSYKSTIEKATTEQANDVINDVIAAVGQSVSAGQRTYLAEVIMEELMDGDGTLDYTDVTEEKIRMIYNRLITAASNA